MQSKILWGKEKQLIYQWDMEASVQRSSHKMQKVKLQDKFKFCFLWRQIIWFSSRLEKFKFERFVLSAVFIRNDKKRIWWFINTFFYSQKKKKKSLLEEVCLQTAYLKTCLLYYLQRTCRNVVVKSGWLLNSPVWFLFIPKLKFTCMFLCKQISS